MARLLIDQGMQPGDRLALVMANHVEFVDIMVGAAIAGVVFVPVDPRTRADKLAFMLDKAQCRGIIAADYALAAVAEAARRCAGTVRWVAAFDTDEGDGSLARAPGIIDYRRSLPDEVAAIEPRTTDPDALMQILFTSGTTGDPKGIACTHRRFCSAAAVVPAAFGYRADDRLYSGLSLTHANAQCITLGAALHARIPCVLSRRFTKSRLWDITRRYGCTTFTLLGGMTTAVYANPPRDDGSAFEVEYIDEPGASAKKCRDGWLWMGDIVHEDDGGWLFFEYRKGGGIRHNGDFVNPGFVEKAIAESLDVDDVYVWGVMAASGAPGEKDVVASVVPRRRSEFDAQAVFRTCRERLEANFVPSYVQVLDEIPKTASEKPQERFLLASFEQDRTSVFTEQR